MKNKISLLQIKKTILRKVNKFQKQLEQIELWVLIET